MKRIVIALLVLMLFLEVIVPVHATESAEKTPKSLVIDFDQSGDKSSPNSPSSKESGVPHTEKALIRRFFSENEMDTDYYEGLLGELDQNRLSSVRFTIVYDRDDGISSKGGSISGTRIVYVDCIYHHPSSTKPLKEGALMKKVVKAAFLIILGRYSKVLSSLATALDIFDPDSTFGNNKVRVNKEYCVLEGSSRSVTKFVELYAPVPGLGTRWYAWGGAESDYVRFGLGLYYKGKLMKKKDQYHQYYTQHYYNTTQLKQLVKNAYYAGQTYYEAADTYAASVGGYAFWNRSISESKYLEYDNLCN